MENEIIMSKINLIINLFDQFTFQLKQITYFTFTKDYNNKRKYLETYIDILIIAMQVQMIKLKN